MFKNTTGQKLTVFAFDYSTGAPKTGDAANLTAYYDLDDAGVTVLTDTSATEKDSTNAKGYYIFDLAQGETNGDKILFSAKSSTANVSVIAVPAVVYTLPATGILAPTTAGRTLDVSAGGEAGIDWANVGSQSTSVNLSATTTNLVNTVTTYTGNTPQTGDSYAIVNGASGLVAIKGDTAATLSDTNELQTDWADGGRLDLILDARASQTSVDTIDGIVDDILLDTAEIGAAGAGLTNINLPDQTMNITGDITGNLSGSVGSVTGAVTVGTINSTASNLKKNAALAAFEFVMTDSTNRALLTGATVTATRSLDGGAFGACANSAAEVGSGVYKIDLAAADMNANTVTLKFSAAGADDTIVTLITQP